MCVRRLKNAIHFSAVRYARRIIAFFSFFCVNCEFLLEFPEFPPTDNREQSGKNISMVAYQLYTEFSNHLERQTDIVESFSPVFHEKSENFHFMLFYTRKKKLHNLNRKVFVLLAKRRWRRKNIKFYCIALELFSSLSHSN